MVTGASTVVEEVAHDKDRPALHEERPSKRQKINGSESAATLVAQEFSGESDDDASSVIQVLLN